MNINWRDFLGEISGYKPLYQATLNELQIAKASLTMCTTRITELDTLLTEAQATILQLTPPTPTPTPTDPTPTDPTPAPTAPDNTTQGATVSRRIRSEQVVDCPMDQRVVPLTASAAGANHDQFTCRHCTYYEKETCDHVTCKYQG